MKNKKETKKAISQKNISEKENVLSCRVDMGRKIEESEDKFHALTNASPDCIKLFDLNGNITYINKSGLEEHRLKSLDDAIKNKWSYADTVSGESRKKLIEAIKDASMGKSTTIEVCHTEKGSVRDFCMETIVPVKNRKGEIVSIFGVSRDVSEMKKNEVRLLEIKESRFNELFENVKSGIAIYKAINSGKDFVFVDINRAVEKSEGVKKQDVIGKNILEVFPGVRKMGLFAVLKEVWRTGRGQHHSTSWYEDKRIKGWRDNYVFKLSTGEVVAAYNDATREKITEQNLRDSELKIRSLVESAEDSICMVDSACNYIYANNTHLKRVGIKSPTSIVGKNFKNFRSAKDAQKFCEAVNEVVRKKKSFSYEYQSARDGIFFLRTLSPVFCPDNKNVCAVTLVSKNINIQKKIESELQEKNDELEKINSIMIGRELKMIELKKRIMQLESGISDEFSNTNHSFWEGKFLQTVNFEEELIEQLREVYLFEIRKSELPPSDKKRAEKMIKILEKDSRKHYSTLVMLAKEAKDKKTI